MIHGKVRKDFAIQVDIGLVELSHQGRVRQSMLTCTGVNTRNPNPTEFSLLLLPVTVGIHQPFFNRILGDCPDIFLTTKEPLGQLQDAFSFGTRSYIVY